MTDGTEGLANAVTGGVLARSVEPETGIGADGHTHEAWCLNCSKRLVGIYCHACGQQAHVHRSLAAFGHDLLHGVVHFEGKIWNTLPLLVWRPGELTRRYIDGQRATFVSPIALFLFTVFLMFAVLGWSGMLDGTTGENIRQGINNTAQEQRELVDRLETQRADEARRGLPTTEIERRLRGARDDLQVTEALRVRGQVTESGAGKEQATITPWLREPIQKIAKNPELVVYKLKTNAYKFSWMLIPISVPFMWLLFPFSRRFRLYDHTVFVTYSLSFMSLLAIGALLLSLAHLGSVAGILFFIPPFHWYRQLKGAYGLTRFNALWRTIVLILFTSVTLSLFITILVALGVFE